MQSKQGFFWGDLGAGGAVGAAMAAAGHGLAMHVSPVWLAFPLAILAGALGGMMLNMMLFARFLGGMETMFQSWLCGALGALVGAWMAPDGVLVAMVAGLGAGVAVFLALRIWSVHIAAQARRGIWS
ncbi:MAG TPA: hypothetical protein VNK45_03655 [Candidatus Acidoferrales bacterium]|nr:hypothetical protein [Candidatus Acidoferrales bacterium]